MMLEPERDTGGARGLGRGNQEKSSRLLGQWDWSLVREGRRLEQVERMGGKNGEISCSVGDPAATWLLVGGRGLSLKISFDTTPLPPHSHPVPQDVLCLLR